MTTLIIGRTGSGKDTLRKILEKDFGWKFVRSYTTRQPRSPDDAKSHIFISEKEAAKMPNRVSYTRINGHEYFALDAQVDESDAYIIDVFGADVLLKNRPDEYFQIIYLWPDSKEAQRNLAIQRSDNPEAEARIFDARVKDETAQFDKFEKLLHDQIAPFPDSDNYEIAQFINTYEENQLRQFAKNLEQHRQFRRNASVVIHDLMEAGTMFHTDDMHPIMRLADPDGNTIAEEHPISVDILCSYVRDCPGALSDMMYRWLSLPSIKLYQTAT